MDTLWHHWLEGHMTLAWLTLIIGFCWVAYLSPLQSRD